MILSQIYFYPVKSCQGQSLLKAEVGPRGIVFDRHWMIVNAQGRFLTQREYPQMALIRPELNQDHLILNIPNQPPLVVDHSSEHTMKVQIWRDQCQARRVSDAADDYLSAYLGQACHLVYLPLEQIRKVDPNYGRASDQVGFADGFPFLLISEASLADLNQRMGLSLPMIRFRPNLVIKGCAPYAEDHWRRIRIGAIEFELVKPCSRCVIPTIDPRTGRRSGQEPLKTLMLYRKKGNAVYFGQNLIHRQTGQLKQGMEVEIIE